MLKIVEEKYLITFDVSKKVYCSYTLSLQPQSTKKNQQPIDYTEVVVNKKYIFTLIIKHPFTYEWKSQYFTINGDKKQQKSYDMMAFSLETYLKMLNDPTKIQFQLTPIHNNILVPQLFNQPIGKLIIKTTFKTNPMVLPVYVHDNIYCKKNIKVIISNNHHNTVICSGELIEIIQAEQIQQFKHAQGQSTLQGYLIYNYDVIDRVRQDNIVILVGNFVQQTFAYDKINIRVITSKSQIEFICNLKQNLSKIKSFMELESIIIVQGIETTIEDGHGIVFYNDTASLYSRIFRSYLHSKIKDKWIIEGIIHYNRSHKHFQDCMSQLSELISQGQQLFPLENEDYCFDEVWKVKAKVIYHILSNMKSLADNGGRSLTSFIIGLAKKRKVTSLVLLKKLKNSYGLDNIKKIYYEQFIISTGLNRIFYELKNHTRENKLEIFLRQKSLSVKVFKLYNLFRIKLQQNYGVVSPLTEKIIKKNKYDDTPKKKQLSGPLCVPQFIKCIPYFTGVLSIQIDNCSPFNFELLQQNIMGKVQNTSSLKSKRILNRKTSDSESQGFTWIMIDTSGTFPAMYKNENVTDKVIESMLKRQYDTQHQQFKILNAISARDHSENQTLCRILIDKVKIKANTKQNSTISIKRKILSILTMFMNKVKDVDLWQDILSLLKLYQPVCYDLSQQGNLFLHSLIQSIGNINYRKQYSYYFEQFHRIMLAISKYHRITTQFKQQQLRKQIMKSIMKWKSTYSLHIINQVKELLQLCICNVNKHRSLIKVIIENVLPYLKQLKIDRQKNRTINQVYQLIDKSIQYDYLGELFAAKFGFQLQQKQNQSKPLDFLIQTFNKLQNIKDNKFYLYHFCLLTFKNVISKNKKKYGLDIQLEHLSQDQNYYLAQYLWKQMCSDQSKLYPEIRLQWMKIYRVFYFYYTPVITMFKIKKNLEDKNKGDFKLTQQQLLQIQNNIMDFIPDIDWFSVYDSSAKTKKKVQNNQDSRRKKRHQQLQFQGKNYITRFIIENPGKQSWEQLAKHALKWIISVYDDKQTDNPNQEKYKQIVQRLKDVNNFLKRGNTPLGYNFDKLKRDVTRVLDEFDQENEDVIQLFIMVEDALKQIQQQKRQRYYDNNGTTIMVPRSILDRQSQNIKHQSLF